MKIAIYTMAKNEAQHVQRFAETTRGADYVVVTDTGSTDGTQDLLRDRGITVHDARIVPWRFDMGTNQAMNNVPGDVDCCIKLDLDEVLWTPDGRPWREVVEELWSPDVHRLRYWYTWSWHVRGEVPAVRFRTANIHGRDNFLWRHPGHAALTCTDFTKSKKMVDTNALEIHHYMISKGRPDYIALLQLAVHECKCPRTLFYLGREYYFRKKHENAFNTLEEYLAHPDAHWKAERAEAMRMLGVTARNMGDNNLASVYFHRAIAEWPAVRDLWFALLEHFNLMGDWLGGYWAGHKCLPITERDSQFTGHTGEAWQELPYLLTANCAWQLGIKSEAQLLLEEAQKQNPDSTRVREFKMMMGGLPV